MKKKAVLFDFDGVIADTEPIYEGYINNLSVEYKLGIDNLADKVRGTTTPNMIETYFSHLTPSEITILEENIASFELRMDMPLVTGSMDFIKYLKDNGYKIALVTSSQQPKMDRALRLLELDGVFDSEVTAARITKSKPDPMCYLLAAQDLGLSPDKCIVFEDSLHGISSGNNAGMRVVGLTTSLCADDIQASVYSHIPNFENLEYVLSLLD